MNSRIFNHIGVSLCIAVLANGVVDSAFAVTDTKPLTINAIVSPRAKLTLGVAAINFPDADPSTTPSVAATENPVSVDSQVRTGAASTATLTVLAASDLTSGANTIAITNVTWTATGAGYVAGTMSTSAAQTVGSWTGSGDRSGTLSFFLTNSWSYATGSYTANSTFTLTAP